MWAKGPNTLPNERKYKSIYLDRPCFAWGITLFEDSNLLLK